MTLRRAAKGCAIGPILVFTRVRLFFVFALEKTWNEYYCICNNQFFPLNVGRDLAAKEQE